MSLVGIQEVRKSFGAVQVLKGVSIEIERGGVVCIIGKSGLGKSTLIRCINGLETFDDGRITVDRIDVVASRKDLRDLHRNVGMIPVTHEMRFVRDVGTKLVFMHQSKVHEGGPPRQLFANPSTPELAQFIGTTVH
jgi:ABC-type polar amino acid transport system ATPase subunit